jgi:hypothetical protein
LSWHHDDRAVLRLLLHREALVRAHHRDDARRVNGKASLVGEQPCSAAGLVAAVRMYGTGR